MIRYAYNPNPKRSVKVYGRGARISTKNSVVVCKALTGLNLDKGKKLLLNLLTQKESLDGKFYTNVVKELSGLLSSAESNAEFKGLDPNKLHIHVSAHKAFTYMRPRRFKMRGERRNCTTGAQEPRAVASASAPEPVAARSISKRSCQKRLIPNAGMPTIRK